MLWHVSYGLTVIFDLLHPHSKHYEKIGLKYFLHTLCAINMSLIADTFFLFFVNYLDYFPLLPSNLLLSLVFFKQSMPSS